MDKQKTYDQTNLAFEFIEKLYFEISYLIKELEGSLRREKEEFVIGRGRGYSINAYNSTALDYPDQWLYKKLSVFFAPKDNSNITGGKTNTLIKEGLKILYLKILLKDKSISSPKILIGVLYEVVSKTQVYKRIEDIIGAYFDYIFILEKSVPELVESRYEDNYLKFRQKFMLKDLFDINGSEDIQEKLLRPVLQLYRQIS